MSENNVTKNTIVSAESSYLSLLARILESGNDRMDRTGTGTRALFGETMRFDLSEWFPLLTTKKVFLRGIIHELLWFIRGETNIESLVQNNVHIWDEWPYAVYQRAGWQLSQQEFIEKIGNDQEFAREHGSLGPVYGHQWRNFNSEWIDQLQSVIDTLKRDPYSRRILVVAYNPAQVGQMLLPPCHMMFQFFVTDGKLSCLMYQRSGDMFLWIPFNIASYSLLTMMIAEVVGLEYWEFVHVIGDTHIYHNHFDACREQLSRDMRTFPTMKFARKITDINDFQYEDFILEGYDPHPSIKAAVAV